MFDFLKYLLAYFTNSNNNNSGNSGTIIIGNGQRYKGNNIVMTNGRVVIDGVDVTGDKGMTVHIDHIIFEGNVEKIDVASSNVIVHGSTNKIKTLSGNVTCTDVLDVTTMSGNVKAKTIKGNVKTTSGDIITK